MQQNSQSATQPTTITLRRTAVWWLGLALAIPFAVGCQGQMRESISFRAMKKPLMVPADHVAMNDNEANVDFPGYPGDAGGPANPVQATQPVLDLGKRKFEAQCGPCHGITGGGDGKVGQVWMPPPPALTDHRFKTMSDGQMYLRIVKGGAGNGALMPSYTKKLSIEERWAVVNYIKASIAK